MILIEETPEQPRAGECTTGGFRFQPRSPGPTGEADDIDGPGAEGPAEREFACPLPHQVRLHAENPHGGPDDRHTRK